MATNGYSDLEAGPEAGWLGHYSLDKAGRLEGGATLSGLIAEAGDTGLVWTDPKVGWEWMWSVAFIILLMTRLTRLSVATADTSPPPAPSA